MKLSVFLLSHNKDGWVQEAVESVLAQDYDDYEFWVIDNSTDDVTRKNLLALLEEKKDPRVIWAEANVPDYIRRDKYVPAWLLNHYYPQATGEVILYLSDDDLFMPGLFAEVATAFKNNDEWQALYFHLARTVSRSPGTGNTWDSRFTGIPADVIRGSGEVDCCIDGGQVAYRTSVLTDIGQPYFTDQIQLGNHADGVHLQKVAELYDFNPLAVCGVVHRHAPTSTWSKG